jgi:hypothetical protein
MNEPPSTTKEKSNKAQFVSFLIKQEKERERGCAYYENNKHVPFCR